MTKILAFHNLAEEGEGFVQSEFYGDNHIDAIPNPEGNFNTNLPTSIPSPFAAIDLTATAFKELAKRKDGRAATLKGNQVYEKLVSQALDVGMVFFHYAHLKNTIKIIRWDKDKQLNEIANIKSHSMHDDPETSLPINKLLSDTLKVHLEADKKNYNFEEMQDLFMVSIANTVVGSTSPRTLFFGTLNPVENDANNHLNVGNDQILFSNEYRTLYERPDDFQLFLYSLSRQINSFGRKFPELNNYLEANLIYLKNSNRKLFNQIEELPSSQYQDSYTTVILPDNTPVRVLDTEIKSKNLSQEGFSKSSFGISSIHLAENQDRPPLILTPGFVLEPSPATPVFFDCKMTDEIRQAIPMSSEIPLYERELPTMPHIKYPYLLTGDFFSDVLYHVQSFDINLDHFLAFRLRTDFNEGEEMNFLCPLKAEAFNYIDVDYLTSKDHFSLEAEKDHIVATLYLETEQGRIKVQKKYAAEAADAKEGEGTIALLEVDINIYPFIKDKNFTQDIIYRTHLTYIDNFPKTTFYKGRNTAISTQESQYKAEVGYYAYKTFITPEAYDYMVFSYEGQEAVIVPFWRNEFKQQNRSLSFAIDFGTTNTYVAYKLDKRESETLNQNEKMLTFFSLEENLLARKVTKEFMPAALDENTNFRFPQRTVIAVTKGINSKEAISLADVRIPFYYETDSHTETSSYHTNLKWVGLTDKENQAELVKGFMEQLVLIMKTKALELGIHPSKCNFIWSYPTSMSEYRKTNFEDIWIELITSHFQSDNNSSATYKYQKGANEGKQSNKIQSISESLAPFYYYDTDMYNSFIYPGVTIDIGGGTTDAIIFKDSLPLKLTSYRYAANTIFGDGYSGVPKNNGFFLRYQRIFMQELEAAELTSALEAITSMLEQGEYSSADLMSTFLAQDDNSDNNIGNGSRKVNFQQHLAEDGSMKIVFFIFYYSLIYHIAHYFKHFDISLPGVFMFSGNGSKILRILDSHRSLDNLAEFTKLVIEHVCEQKISHDVTLQMSENPKAITAKGSLKSIEKSVKDPKEIKEIMPSTTNVNQKELFTYKELVGTEHALIDEVTNDVLASFKVLQDILEEIETQDSFHINDTEFRKAVKFMKNPDMVRGYVKQGLDARVKELRGNLDTKIKESLFFMPFAGLLNQLAFKIASGEL